MEVGRHQSAQLAEGFDPSAAPLKGEMRGILGDARAVGGFLDGGSRRRKPRVNALDQVVRGHASKVAAVFCGLQAETQNSAITAEWPPRYAKAMPYDAERLRSSIRRVMRENARECAEDGDPLEKGEAWRANPVRIPGRQDPIT